MRARKSIPTPSVVQTEDVEKKEAKALDELLGTVQLMTDDLISKGLNDIADSFIQTSNYCKEARNEVWKLRKEIDKVENKFKAYVDEQRSPDIILKLKEAYESAWREADAAKLREQIVQSQLEEIREKMVLLEAQIPKNIENDEYSRQFGVMSHKKETVLKERDRLQSEVEELTRRLQMQRLYAEEVEKKRLEAIEFKEAILEKMAEISHEKSKLEKGFLKLEDENTNLKSSNQHLKKALDSTNEQLTKVKEILSGKDKEVTAIKSLYDKVKSELNQCNKSLLKKTHEVDACRQGKELINERLKKQKFLTVEKEKENQRVKKSCKLAISGFEGLASKLNQAIKNNDLLKSNIFRMNTEMIGMEKEHKLQEKQFKEQAQELTLFKHEHDLLQQTNEKFTLQIKDLEISIHVRDRTIKKLTIDHQNLKGKVHELNKSLQNFNRERHNLVMEIQELEATNQTNKEELFFRAVKLKQANDLIDEKNLKVNEIQKELDATTSERNAFQRNVQALTEEKNYHLKRLGVIISENTHLKEQISIVEKKNSGLNLRIRKCIKAKNDLNCEVQKISANLRTTRTDLKSLKTQNLNLSNQIVENDKKIKKQQIMIDHIDHNKHIITSQMIRRNDEIGMLREKLDVIRLALSRGENQYQKRLQDINILKIAIVNLTRQRDVMANGVANVSEMRRDLIRAQRLYMQETVKNKMLLEEMQAPVNIHRWRRLKGTNPSKMRLIEITESLKRRILVSNVHAEEKQNIIDHYEEINVSLRNSVQNLVKKNNSYVMSLQKKNKFQMPSKKYKALIAELNCKDKEVMDKQCIVAELQNKLEQYQKARQ